MTRGRTSVGLRAIARDPRLRDALPLLPVCVALTGLAFADGGFFSGAWATAAVGLLWLAGLDLLLADRLALTPLEWRWIGLVTAFLVWTASSLAWSVNDTEPLFELRRGVVYLAGIGAILLASTRRSTPHVLIGVWASVSAVVVYALGRYLLTAHLRSDEFQANLLFRPVGYANALGILAGIAFVVATGLMLRATIPTVRVLAAASTVPLTAALCLTESRASVLAVAAGLGAMVLLDRDRLRLVVSLAFAGPVLVAVFALCEHYGLTDPARAAGDAEHRARLLALWIVLGTAVLALVPWAVEKADARVVRFRRLPVRLVVGIVGAAVLAAGAVLGHGTANRFFTTGSRPAYWHVAWTQYTDHPWLGSGAGTFADYWLRYGDPTLQGGALDAHNLYLETLAEVGPVGLALLAAVLATPFVSAVRRRSQPLVPAALGAYVAFLAHAALDWDWEMPVVTLAALSCASAVVVTDRSGARELSPLARFGALVVVVGLALFALAAQVFPGLGGRFR